MYSCQFCYAKFESEDDYERHMDREHGVRLAEGVAPL